MDVPARRLLLGALRAMGAPFATFTALLAAALAFFAAIGLEFLGVPISNRSSLHQARPIIIQHLTKHVSWAMYAAGSA